MEGKPTKFAGVFHLPKFSSKHVFGVFLTGPISSIILTAIGFMNLG